MEKLAVELLVDIFTFACTDGGPTSCSLSLVCKHFREISRPLRFYTVTLTGIPGKIRCLLDCLRDARATHGESAAPKVRHLFLTAEDILWKQDTSVAFSLDLDEYSELLTTFMRAIAPDLYTFTLLPHPYAWPIQPGLEFPVLREFTFKIDDDMYNVYRHDEGTQGDPPLYPSLERLHVLGSHPRIEFWSRHAPGITHLRVSDLGFNGHTEKFQSIHGEAGQKPPFPQLQLVIFQPTLPPPQLWYHGRPYAWYTQLVPALWNSQSAARVPVYFPPPVTDIDDVPPVDVYTLRDEWEDRVEGRPGCWNISDLEEYARSAYEGDKPPSYLAPWLYPTEDV